MPRGDRNTKDEIVRVGMRMFVEQGYDKTTLREIADELGVTKAALYYHFRTKEDIVHAALDAHTARIDGIVQWLDETDAGDARDKELVDRLLDIFTGPSNLAMRFSQSNPTVLSRKEFGARGVDQMYRLVTTIAGRDRDAERALRALAAFASIAVGTLDPPGDAPALVPGTPQQRHAAARKVAVEMLASLRAPD